MQDGMGLIGVVQVQLFDQSGDLKVEEIIKNGITDVGDEYYAKKAIVGISPAGASATTPVDGMKLGTGTTAVSKAGAGAALVTYKSGSNVVFDATYPQAANLGSTLGWNAVYRTTWAAGVATDAALTEAVICNNQATNGAGTAANIISRVVFSAINKTATDVLVITWNHKFLGTV
jgi:hypothetical protein